MSYQTIIEMVSSPSLSARVAAAAAGEGITDPTGWATTHKWVMASQPGWGEAWAYAVDTTTVNMNPDTGVRDDVISDAMILSAVQAVIAAEQG